MWLRPQWKLNQENVFSRLDITLGMKIPHYTVTKVKLIWLELKGVDKKWFKMQLTFDWQVGDHLILMWYLESLFNLFVKNWFIIRAYKILRFDYPSHFAHHSLFRICTHQFTLIRKLLFADQYIILRFWPHSQNSQLIVSAINSDLKVLQENAQLKSIWPCLSCWYMVSPSIPGCFSQLNAGPKKGPGTYCMGDSAHALQITQNLGNCTTTNVKLQVNYFVS